MTNSIPTAIPYLEHVLKVYEQLYGLPALPLIFVGCIALGYALKSLKAFDNRYIPRWVFGFAVICNLVLAPFEEGTSMRIWAGRTVILGVITAAAAWLFHAAVLKKIERKFGWFPTGDTQQFIKPKDETKP